MAMLELATPERHGDVYRVALDGAIFELSWSWNERSQRWWFRLSDDAGQIAYLPVVTGLPMLRSVTGTRRPTGELLVLDRLDKGREPALRNFGTDFLLLYIEAAQLPEGY